MNNLYELVYDLMGKDESNKQFQLLSSIVEETPNIYLDHKHSREYFYSKSGIALSFMKAMNCFAFAFFHIATNMVKSGNVTMYRGNLPNEITVTDGPVEIEEKMSQKPISSELGAAHPGDKPTLWIKYRSGEVIVGFAFTDSVLELVSLTYKPERMD